MDSVKLLDLRAFSCALPIVKAKRAMDRMKPGQVLEIIVTNKATLNEIPIWSKMCHHTIIGQRKVGHLCHIYLQKAPEN